jgi:hypothetical protein
VTLESISICPSSLLFSETACCFSQLEIHRVSRRSSLLALRLLCPSTQEKKRIPTTTITETVPRRVHTASLARLAVGLGGGDITELISGQISTGREAGHADAAGRNNRADCGLSSQPDVCPEFMNRINQEDGLLYV